jgi:UDP-N-acetylglucosamine--N-acetylmuramyl-(pentapeptide) pyrophosphoryl-undecaprenol N-acetylglucosamine transferase
MSLVNENAAIMIKDVEANKSLVSSALKLLFDEQQCDKLKENISRLAKPNATEEIVDEIEKLIGIESEVRAIR